MDPEKKSVTLKVQEELQASKQQQQHQQQIIMKRFSQDWGPRRIRARCGSPRFGGRPTRWHGSGAAAARLGGVGRRSSPTPRTLSHGGALADLTDFGVRGQKKSIFPKYLRTVGESKGRHGGPNGSHWDPPSTAIRPGTPPHTQPEMWPIFMFLTPRRPQGTWPVEGPGGLGAVGSEWDLITV